MAWAVVVQLVGLLTTVRGYGGLLATETAGLLSGLPTLVRGDSGLLATEIVGLLSSLWLLRR